MLSLEQNCISLIISRIDGGELPSSAYREKAFQLTGRALAGFHYLGGERHGGKKIYQ